MSMDVYGFLIDEDILFDAPKKRLIQLRFNYIENRSCIFGVVVLSDALVKLLIFMISSGYYPDILTKESILTHVWDNNHRVSSSQKLWLVLRELKLKLEILGCQKDFIIKVRGKGYSINKDHVRVLYY